MNHLAWAWGLWLMVVAWRWRPAPTRVHQLDRAVARPEAVIEVSSEAPGPPSAPRWHRPLVGLGATVVGRVPALRPVPDLWVGVAIVVAAGLFPWSIVAGVVALGAALGVGALAARRRHRRLERLQAAQLVSFLQIVSVTVGAGATLRTSMVVASARVAAPLGDVLAATQRRLDRGATVAEALGSLSSALAPPQRVVIDRLRSAELVGAPLGPLLRGAASGLSDAHRRDAEIRARRLPVLMLMPLVCCVLPAFVVLAIVPMVVSGSSSLFPL